MRKPGVLVIHNRYQLPGGEDTVVHAEVEVLRRHGHTVTQFGRDNSDIRSFGIMRTMSLGLATTWNHRAYWELRNLIRRTQPAVAHCHNLVPLISPSAYYACRDEGIPVVQSLHNFRLRCPAGSMFRQGATCAGCCASLAHSVVQGCYRRSRAQTAAAALMLGTHRKLGTYRTAVDAYCSPSAFCAEKIATVIPREKIYVRPNFLLDDPGVRESCDDFALFVGRVSAEKGLRQLLGVFRRLPRIRLVVVGDGPMLAEAQQTGSRNLIFTGALPAADTLTWIKSARFLVVPSIGFETFGMAVLEAAACGVAAVATRLGGIPELVQEAATGLLFNPHDLDEFAAKVQWAWSHPDEMKRMGLASRQQYLRRMTAEDGYNSLVRLYASVCANWEILPTNDAVA